MTNNIAGLDLHKSRSYITVMDGNGQILGEENLASKAEPILNYLRDLTPKPEVVFEATRNWYWLYDALQREGFRVTMAHPNKTKVIAEAKIKTDRVVNSGFQVPTNSTNSGRILPISFNPTHFLL